jgi:hypothetical protein
LHRLSDALLCILGGVWLAETWGVDLVEPRQTVNLGGETEKLDPDLNQLGGTQTANRLVFTIGKYSIVDIFDTNTYAHDPRHDFLNWSIIDQGAFDYAANAWGYTLAYCLHVTLARRLHALAPGLTPRSVLEKFAAVQMIDVHLPTTDGRELMLTRYTEPDYARASAAASGNTLYRGVSCELRHRSSRWWRLGILSDRRRRVLECAFQFGASGIRA